MLMKIKLSLFSSAFIVALVAVALSNSSFGQGYGSQQGGNNKPAAAGTPATGRNAGRKPGEVLTGGAIVATPITEEEAKKKYPMPGGKAYPVGDRDIHKPSGWVTSPHSGQDFDCSQIPYGGLVLDTKANKVFVRPKTK